MRLKVCKQFTDKETGMKYTIGRIIEVSEKRGAEILANPLGLAEAVVEVVKDTETPQEESASAPKPSKRKRKRSDNK